MAYIQVSLPAPAGNGSGAAVDVSGFGATKTITVTKGGTTHLRPSVLIEVSNQSSPTKWAPLAFFQPDGEQTYEVAARWMRATTINFRGGDAPVVEIGGEDDGTEFATLTATAGNGSSAGVDTSALGTFKTVHVAGPFQGACNIEVSQDGGTTYQQALSFLSGQSGIQSKVIAADYMRVTRNGVPDNNPGTPIINIGACTVGSGSDTVSTDDYTAQGDGDTGSVIAWKLGYFLHDVRRYGATGDGVTDDRPFIQAAIDAASAAGGGTVYLPDGTYLVSRTSVGLEGCLYLKSNVALVGESREGAIIKLAANQLAFTRPIRIDTQTDVTVSDLTIDGNISQQTPEEHMAGIFAGSCSRLLIDRVTSFNNAGDGIDIYSGCADVLIEKCYLYNNDRAGVAFNGIGSTRVTIRDCQCTGNAGQQIDTELSGAGTLTDISIISCYLGAPVTTGYVLTLSGYNTSNRSTGYVVDGCVIAGSVYMVWAKDVRFVNNRVYTSATDNTVPVVVDRNCENITIAHNRITAGAVATANASILFIEGIAAGSLPINVIVQGNSLETTVNCVGVKVFNPYSLKLIDNAIKAASTNTTLGIEIRQTINDAAAQAHSVEVSQNRVTDFRTGMLVWGNSLGVEKITDFQACHNVWEKISNASFAYAMDLEFANQNIIQQATLIGNSLAGVASMFGGANGGWPGAIASLIGGNRGNRGIYSGTSTPEGAVTESIGAMFLRRDGGASTTLYIKESGSATNTGWIAK